MENIEESKVKKITTQQVARILGKSDEFIRVRFTTPVFFRLDLLINFHGRKKYSYFINYKQFEEYIKNEKI